MPLTFGNTTVAQQFAADVAAAPARVLKGAINLYMAEWAKFWGAGVTQNTPQGPQRGSMYPSLTILQRIAAIGTDLVALFELNNTLKTFIETQANAYIAANGVPVTGSTMDFLLGPTAMPYVVNGVFALPGVPAGYVLTPNADGSGTLSLTPPPAPAPAPAGN